MLPFLKESKEASISAPIDHQMRKSDEDEGEEEFEGMDAVADDLMRGILTRDRELIKHALYSAHIIYDSELHHEGPHTKGSES